MNIRHPSKIEQAADILETLLNLNYLIRQDSGDCDKVQLYSSLVQERLQTMVDLVRPALRSDYREVKLLIAAGAIPPLLPC